MKLTLRTATDQDVHLLAALNKQLIEDEQHDNAMSVEQLKQRMAGFLNSQYTAYLFEHGEQMLGYALVDHAKQPLYLRQFFICRDCRQQGYGKAAFQTLLEALATNMIDIEVMHWNERAYAFWKSLGFRKRSIYMRLDQ